MKIILSSLILAMALSVCRSPEPKPSIAFKEIQVSPEFRCPRDRILSMSWSLTDAGGVRVRLKASFNNQDFDQQIFDSEDDSATKDIDLIDATSHMPDFQFPNTVVVTVIPVDDGEQGPYGTINRKEGDPKTFTITTVNDPIEIERPAIRRDNEDAFNLDLDPVLFSSSLNTDKITLVSGCTNPLSGRYSWDKGLAVPSTETLENSNNFSDTFGPVQAQGQYVIKPLDQECSKDVSEIRVKMRFSCANK